MKRIVFFAALFASIACAQVTWTPPVKPTTAIPGRLVTLAGSGTTAINCTLAGNAVPATGITMACTLGTITIPSYSVPAPASSVPVTWTFQMGTSTATATVAITLSLDATAGIDFSATVNGGPPVTGTF